MIRLGEQMAMARVFYHKPKFAILDGGWISMISQLLVITDRSLFDRRMYECCVK